MMNAENLAEIFVTVVPIGLISYLVYFIAWFFYREYKDGKGLRSVMKMERL